MTRRLLAIVWTLGLPALVGLLTISLSPTPSARAADDKDKAAAKPKVTYKEVSAIFQARCYACHNADKQKGGLTLDNYASAMAGGGSGKVIEPGDPDSSTLWLVVSHTEQPFMPPEAPKLPDNELAIIRGWIEGGAPESAGSTVAMKAKPKLDLKLDPSMMGKPAGEPAFPKGISSEPVVQSTRANAIVALAHSPWAPLVAVAGQKQVLLYQTNGGYRLVGVLPFPEGNIHVLKFTRNGELLLAAGGRGGQSGVAVTWEVKTGKRLFEIGKEKEYDAVLAADLSPDQSLVAVGGPSKVVRVYNTSDGSVAYELRKHTEWITALEFSPDGVLLATGDRNNGLLVWEAQTGREFHDLRNHTAAITDVSWRLDSNVLASSSEDGNIRLWEMENGGNIKGWGAHGGGVASIEFLKDGRILSTGRDRVTRLWDQNGGKQRDFEGFNDLGLEVVPTQDDNAVVAADWSGEIRVWKLADGTRLTNLVANPAPLVARIDQTAQQLSASEAAAAALAKELDPLKAALAAQNDAVAKLQPGFAQAQQVMNQKTAELTAAQQQLTAKTQAEAAATAAVQAAQAALTKATADKAALEKAAADTAIAEKAATDALANAKTTLQAALTAKTTTDQAVTETATALKAATTAADVEKLSTLLSERTLASVEKTAVMASTGRAQAQAQAAMDKAIAAKTQAAQAAQAAPAMVVAATTALKAAQDAVAKLTAEKNTAAAAVAAVQPAATAATNAFNAAKAQFDQANQAKAASEQALNAKAAAVQAAQAKAAALKSDLDLMRAEAKAKPDAPRADAGAKGPKAS